MKTIMTVCGAIEAERCGLVLSHEHLFIDLRNQATPNAADRKISSADRAVLMCDPYCLTDNLCLDCFDLVEQEVKDLHNFSCGTIVDCTLTEIGRNPQQLKRLSKATSLNIIMGCGWYTADTHPPGFEEMSIGRLADCLVDEILNGVGASGIRPGIIGEIGTSKTILPGEKKALAAAALAQKETGLSIQVHIYPWSCNGLEVLDILFHYGVSPDRIVICHSDVNPEREYIAALLKRGVYVELDNFGKEFTPAEGGFASGKFVSDRERVELAAWIIKEGYTSQLLLTNDICLKCMLQQYGGGGYSHLFRTIVPMLGEYGIAPGKVWKEILHDNPVRMLQV